MFGKIRNFFKKKPQRVDRKLPFREVFSRFRQVLDSNNLALQIMADMGDKMGGDYIFDINYIKSAYAKFADAVFKSIYNLNALAQNRYLYLHGTYEKINSQINRILQGKPVAEALEPVLFYKDISWEFADAVGGKNSAIATMYNNLKINVPEGFAITTGAFKRFVEYNGIEEKIEDLKQKYKKASQRSRKDDIMTTATFAEAGEHETAKEIVSGVDYMNESFLQDIRELFLKGDIPADISEIIEATLETMKINHEGPLFLAVRSSAEEEDTEFSFAGQFETELNVPAERKPVEEAYRKVLASLYSRKAMAYKEHIMPEDNLINMSVGCMKMVNASASGVMNTIDPTNLNNDVIIINANWGLGKTVVDGSVDADHFIISKDETYRVIDSRTGKKNVMISADPKGGVSEMVISPEEGEKQCLNEEQLKKLAHYAVTIEHYFKKPQDIEWAIDRKGDIFIVQSRPLRVSSKIRAGSRNISCKLDKYDVIMEGKGVIAQRGIGSGKVFVLKSLDDLKDFVAGSILVARHDSSHFIRVMPKASAIITDMGTPTSHMANIAREFQVPTIVNTGDGTTVLNHGEEITVDADDNRIYKGIIQELMKYRISSDIDLKGSKEFRLLKKMLRYITPLNLIDPLLENFTPEGCKTFHDIIRFIHEKAIAELVNVKRYEGNMLKDNVAIKLDVSIPTGIFIIDIGGGLDLVSGSSMASFDEITSIPFKSIMSGMMHPGVWHSDSVSMRVNDFMSSMMKMPDISSMRYLGDNIAVISREYVNMSLRFGYHFNMLDCYCSENVRDNHIYFRFVGGATDISKRSRRAE
ncbi:MAG TPA: hypothetical protein ENG75_06885, partial [Nitrospirae bacterium]|nr:hypothetical protein [Nitrospirota bacterium]